MGTIPWEGSVSVSTISSSEDLSERALLMRVIFVSAKILTSEMDSLVVVVCKVNKCMCADMMVCSHCADMLLVNASSALVI